MKLIDRFLAKVRKTRGCWIWTAARFQNGYGSVSIKHKTYKASRVAYEIFFGKIKKGKHVLHRCDNRLCVKPDHLFLGTHQDNVDDMVAKKRNNRGEDRPQSKLTRKDVARIRKFLLAGKHTKADLGRMFGIDRAVIGRIANNTAWV